MIGRIRRQHQFAQLAQAGDRIAATYLWCNWCLEPNANEPKLAFAITRAYGTAVQRNRLRRRIRAVLSTWEQPLPVLMLIGSRANKHQFGPLTFDQVTADLETITNAIRQRCTTTMPTSPNPHVGNG